MFCGRNLLQHQQWEYRQSHLAATSAIVLSFQVLYNLPVLCGQEQDTASLCPFLTLRICLGYRIWWRRCSTAPTSAVLRNEEWRVRQRLGLCVQSVLWQVQLHTMNGSHDLAFWKICCYWPQVLFLNEVLRYSVSALVHDLVTVGDVGWKLHCFRDDIWIWISVTLPTCVHYWLHKTVEAFLWCVLNKAVYCCAKKNQW